MRTHAPASLGRRVFGDEHEHPATVVAARVGLVAWSLVGSILVVGVVLAGLATVSELVFPVLLAFMAGVVASPLARRLQRAGWGRGLAAAAVVLGATLAAAAVVLVVVATVVQETGALADEVDAGLRELAATTDGIGLDEPQLDSIRGAVRDIAGVVGRGLLTAVIGGISAVVGFVAGSVLALLIMYYLLKDGPEMRAWLLARVPGAARQEATLFTAGAVRSIRAYWAGRAALSAVVTVVFVIAGLAMDLPLVATIAVVNFVGGFVPYLGAVVGGGLAALLALSHGGWTSALVMIAVAIGANLLLENLLEPRIMSGKLAIHPLSVLIATTVGGVLGGMLGLMIAVPATAVGIDLASRLRRMASQEIADNAAREVAVR